MKDQHSTSEDKKEPARPRSIPDDFIWDPEVEAWYPPGEPTEFDAEASLRELQEICKRIGPCGVITRDELLAAGALEIPPGWGKRLGGGPRRQLDLFANQLEDDAAEISPAEDLDEDDEESADE
ncbi:MAG: hypothetical protein ACR2OZ_17000 [Verrucomicrobiales bacterium]